MAKKSQTVKDPLTKKQRAKVQADAVKKHQESGEVLKDSDGTEFAPVPPEALTSAKKKKTPENPDAPKVAVLKKHMDLEECKEAVGKLKEFVVANKDESQRELAMAIKSLGASIKSVETWLTNIDDVVAGINKKLEKAEEVKAEAKA